MNEIRELSVRIELTLPTGASLNLGGDDVIDFTVEEGADSALLPGAVLSSTCRITLAQDTNLGEKPLVGATAQIFLTMDGEEKPCGVFQITAVSLEEHSGCLILSGEDSIASELSGTIQDDLSYPATLSDVWRQLIGRTRYTWSGTLPSGDSVIDIPPNWNGATLRRAAGWIAQAAGCFVKVGRSGELQILPCQDESIRMIEPDEYLTLTDGLDSFGPIAAVRITPEGAEESFTLSDGAGETVTVSGNPLFAAGAEHLEELAKGMLRQLSGLTLTRADFTWRGDPALTVGSRADIVTVSGKILSCTITRQTLCFQDGFSAQCECILPDSDDGGILRALTPEGGVNANALVGTVNGGLLAAGSVTARAIAAKGITAEKLDAGSVTADKLDAGSVSGRMASFWSAEARKLSADDVQTSELYASAAHIVTLAAQSLSAGRMEADDLAAALCRVISLHAGTGEFDLATIANLVASALVLEQGSAGSMRIANLAVMRANLLSAVLDELILKGSDGEYYTMFVGADGTISARQTQVGAQDAENALETSVNVGALDAKDVRAESAILSTLLSEALTAGRITAGDALLASASIPQLYTSAVQALGDGMEFSANRTIKMILGAVDEIGRWFTFDNERGLMIQKPAYTDSNGTAHAASIWRTITDETGYHIQRTDLTGYVASFARDRLIVDGVQLGGISARRTASGGWAWKEA